MKGKLLQLPFRGHFDPTSTPLQVIHGVKLGPITPSTNSGKRYFLTLVDQHTSYISVILLSQKLEAMLALLSLIIPVTQSRSSSPMVVVNLSTKRSAVHSSHLAFRTMFCLLTLHNKTVSLKGKTRKSSIWPGVCCLSLTLQKNGGGRLFTRLWQSQNVFHLFVDARYLLSSSFLEKNPISMCSDHLAARPG